jgi:dolichol kinase
MTGRGRLPLFRPGLHAATGFLALLLGVLSRPLAIAAAALGVVVGWVVLPLTLEAKLRRPGEPYLGGLRTYPLAVLGLVLLLPPAEAAAAWGVLAFGDAAAAVVGRLVPSPALLGHPKATWAGSGAYLVVGAIAAALLAAGVDALAGAGGAGAPPPGLVRCLLAAAAAAASDLVDVPPDDNLPAAAAAGLALVLSRGVGGLAA